MPHLVSINSEYSDDCSDDSLPVQETEHERLFLYEIILRAIRDINFILTPTATPEQKLYGRSALSWIFIERSDNLPFLYPQTPPHKKKSLEVTSFDNICGLLDIDSDYLRERIMIKYSLTYMKPFTDM